MLFVEPDRIITDLTAKDGVVEGMVFLVLRRDSEGGQTMRVVGEAVIREIEPKLSQATILIRHDQIRPGDLVRTKPDDFAATDVWRPPPTEKRLGMRASGPIAFNEIWRGSVHVTGDITDGVDVLPGAATLTVKNNVVERNGAGVHGGHPNLEILGNRITSNDVGLSLSDARSVIGNVVSHNGSLRGGAGMLLRNRASGVIVSKNTITDHQLAIACLPPVIPNLGDLGNDNPEDDGGNIFLRNRLNLQFYAYPIHAEGNFWGSAEPGEIARRLQSPNRTILENLPEDAIDLWPYRLAQRSNQLSDDRQNPARKYQESTASAECSVDVSWSSWQSCREPVWINQGDTLTLRARGKAAFGDIESGPAGIGRKAGVESLAPGFPEYSLVGRIGLWGDTFLIGAGTAHRPTESGYLYFGVNETVGFTNLNSVDAKRNYGDNSGYYSVRVSVRGNRND